MTVDLASLGITYTALAISDQRGILSCCLRPRRHQPNLCEIVAVKRVQSVNQLQQMYPIIKVNSIPVARQTASATKISIQSGFTSNQTVKLNHHFAFYPHIFDLQYAGQAVAMVLSHTQADI
jgi:hypothetical protein